MDCNTIHCGDCLDVLRTLPDNSVDSVVTDPPYGIDYQSAWRTAEKRKPKIANDETPFIWWLYDAARVMREGAALACFCEWRHEEKFRMAIECAGLTIRSQCIWDRDWHGMGDLKSSFSPCHDIIWFATKGKGFAFPKKRPSSVLRYRRVSPDALLHPNEKPVELLRDLVQSITPPKGIVLDPFAGSGSTLVAAMLEGLNFIGIEREAEYVEIAKARVAHVNRDTLGLFEDCE
jgi:site-specific DNA-methyltransferase (adenine-specific)